MKKNNLGSTLDPLGPGGTQGSPRTRGSTSKFIETKILLIKVVRYDLLIINVPFIGAGPAELGAQWGIGIGLGPFMGV